MVGMTKMKITWTGWDIKHTRFCITRVAPDYADPQK